MNKLAAQVFNLINTPKHFLKASLEFKTKGLNILKCFVNVGLVFLSILISTDLRFFFHSYKTLEFKTDKRLYIYTHLETSFVLVLLGLEMKSFLTFFLHIYHNAVAQFFFFQRKIHTCT